MRTSSTSASMRTLSSSSPPSSLFTGGNASSILSRAARRTLEMRYERSSGVCSSILRCAEVVSMVSVCFLPCVFLIGAQGLLRQWRLFGSRRAGALRCVRLELVVGCWGGGVVWGAYLISTWSRCALGRHRCHTAESLRDSGHTAHTASRNGRG